MFGYLKAACASLALIALPMAASAATVSTQGGDVFVNTGKGFVPLSGAAKIAAGGQIMVRPGGSAVIAYSSQCSVRVGSGRVWKVQAAAPCTDGNRFIDMTTRMNQSADEEAAAAQCLVLGVECTTAAVGALAIGGAVTGIVLLANDDDDPASP